MLLRQYLQANPNPAFQAGPVSCLAILRVKLEVIYFAFMIIRYGMRSSSYRLENGVCASRREAFYREMGTLLRRHEHVHTKYGIRFSLADSPLGSCPM